MKLEKMKKQTLSIIAIVCNLITISCLVILLVTAPSQVKVDKADYPLFVVTGKWLYMSEFAKSYSLTIVYEAEKGRCIYRPIFCKTVYHEGVFIYDKVNVWKNSVEEGGCYLEPAR